MRVVVVTQDELLYLPVFFRPFLYQAARNGIYIAEVVILRPFNETTLKTMRRMYQFYGFWDFTRQAARYASLRLRDALHSAPVSVTALASQAGIPCRVETDINASASLEALRAKNPDVILSVGATQIFKSDLLTVPRWGCINIHTAKLPKYRGMLPTFWALYHGDGTVGMTIFKMDEAIDKGNIILQEELPIAPDETLDSLIRKTKAHEADMAIRTLHLIRDGNIHLRDYEGEGSYFTFPKADDVRALRRRGGALL